MITSEKIKNLRNKTGAGMMDCKKALEESQGDLNNAVDWLRKKGINTAQKKSSRDASEGLITISITENCASIIEVNSETDFVARNKDFQSFTKRIADFIVEKKISNKDDINDLVFTDSTLSFNQEFTSLIAKVGENLIFKRSKFFEEDGLFFQKYLHNSVNDDSGKIGVILSYSCKNNDSEQKNIAKNICMHIAAADPKALNSDLLDHEIVNKEKEIYLEQLRESGKSEDIIEKIISGKIKKFYEDVCLQDQFFVMDNKIKIKDYLGDFNKKTGSNFEINNFTLFKVGENI